MPETNMYLEKRIHPRVSVQVPVTYSVLDDQEKIQSIHRQQQKQAAQSQDLSLGGVFLIANLVLRVGSVLSLEIALPGRDRVVSPFAEVVWSNDSGLGLQFVALKEKDEEALGFFISQKINYNKKFQHPR